MHDISKETTSSLRFRVEHCHVQAKCAFTTDGTVSDYFVSTGQQIIGTTEHLHMSSF